MIKLIVLAIVVYFAFSIKNKFISKHSDTTIKDKNSYKNLNIKDADYEDIDKDNS